MINSIQFGDCCTDTPRTHREYCNYLYGFVANMFTWDCDFAPDWIFERLLTARGTIGIFRNDGDIVVASGGYTGTPSRYGTGVQYIGADFAGKTYTGTVSDDVVVLWNNSTLSSDISTICSYATRFVESDRSILNVLRGARITALVTATDNTDKRTLDNVVAAINNGDTIVPIAPSFREIDALDNGANRFDILRITDPDDTDKLQYLTRYRDDLLAAFLGEYGLDVNVVNKSAQVSHDELHSMSDVVGAVIADRLAARRRDLDIVRSWGVNINVMPSDYRNGGMKNDDTSD